MQNIRDYILDDLRANKIYPTPAHIAEEMVNVLPDTLWNNPTLPEKKFLDICCKSGIFLIKLRDKLMTAPAMVKAIPDEKERRKHILKYMLYGIAPCNLCEDISRIELYGKIYIHGNIHTIENYYNDYTEIFKFENAENKVKYLINNKFSKPGGDKVVTFDVVIGNPPYNRGMDLDFVDMAYNLTNENDGKVCMITPAKWQTAEANQTVASNNLNYGQFREKIVPHMSHVCFYPCCKDVFDIYQTDGITYFHLDKSKTFEKATVVNKCNDIACFNGTEERSILNTESLLNIGQEIIDSLGDYPRFHFPVITHNKRYEVWMNTKVSGYDWYDTKNPRYVLSISRLIDNNKGDKYDGEAKCVFESDSIAECKSFVTWIYSRFTRFFLVPNISKLNNIQTDHCFRFVPAPAVLDTNGNRVEGKFDHIYTDEELYKTFNLPQKYIDIIESTIKERNYAPKNTDTNLNLNTNNLQEVQSKPKYTTQDAAAALVNQMLNT